MRIKLSKSDWQSIGTKMGWLKKTAGFGNMAKELLELGKDVLGDRSKTVKGSALSPDMPRLLLDNLEWVDPEDLKLNITVRKFVPGSPDASDYSITVVEVSSPDARRLPPSPYTVSRKDIGMLDRQLQQWMSKNKDLVHEWVSRLIEKEM